MTAEQLMMPRFEILRDFPNNKLGKVGEILDGDRAEYPNNDESLDPIWRVSDFPHLFRKLNWWEHRKVEDMPKKVYHVDYPNTHISINSWDIKILFLGFLDAQKTKCVGLLSFKPEQGYFPID